MIIVESREVLQPHTGLIKDIDFLTGAFMVQCLCNSCRNSASICICEILLSVHSEPLVLHLFSCPEVMDADFVSFPSALRQNVVLKDIGMPANAARSVDRRFGRMVKVIIFVCSVSARDESPSCYKLSVYGVVDIVLQLKQPSQLSGIDAIFAKVIVILFVFILIAGQLLDAGERLVVLEIIDIAIKGTPAAFNGFIQRIAVRKGAEGGGKVTAAGMGGIFRLGIRINTILLLEGLLAGHGVKRVSTQVDVIADITAVYQRQAVIFIPCRVILRSQRDAADNDNGVGGLSADRLTLLDPVDGKCQRVRCLIQLCIAQGEIVIHDRQIGEIDRRILIECNLHLHICLAADTLGKLQQDIPCGDIIQIAASHHLKQRNKLFGHLHFLHIQCKGVLGHHGQIGTVDIVGVGSDVIHGCGDAGGVGHLTVPGQRTVAKHGGVKVKLRFIRIVEGQTHGCLNGIVLGNHCGNLYIPDTGSRIAGKLEVRNSAGRAIAQIKDNIRGIDGHGVAFVGGRNGQINGFPINGVDAAARKEQRIRKHHIQGLASNHHTIHRELNFSAAGSDRSKGIILNGADGGIHHNPLGVLRQICGVAGAADTADREGQAAANRQIISIRGNQGMVKCVGGLRRGNYQQGGANRTLISIRGTVHNRDLVSALLLGVKGSGASAVQVDSNNAARFQHDLGDLLGVAAGGEGLLPSVQHHHDDLALSSDTHTSAGMTAVIIVRRTGHDRLRILDQECAAAHSLLDLILVGCVVAGAADDGRAVLQDRKEVLTANAMVLHTFHNQCATGSAVAHVIEVCIDAQHRVIVFDVVVRIVRVRVLGLGRRHLIGDAGHRPRRRIVVVIVGVDADIITADVNGGRVEDDLLAVRGQRICNILGNAGSQSAGGVGEHSIIAVLRRIRLWFGFRLWLRVSTVLIARKYEQVVRKCIAAGGLQSVMILQVEQFIGTFQSSNQGVGGVGIQNSLTDTRFCLNIAQTVLEKIGRAALIAERTGEIAL